jgi:protein phosphatase
MLTVATLSHPGHVRANNEDSVLWSPDIGLLAVADGMGGHNAGEVASRMALDVLSEHLRSTAGADHIAWLFGFDPSLSVTANRLLTAVKLANEEVFKAAAEKPEYEGMGTTVVLGIVDGSRLTYVSVGDSRLYSVEGGSIRQLTRDDSWIERLADTPGLDRSAIEHLPIGNLLTSVVGPRPEIDPAVFELDLTDGQTLLLTTDGMYRKVPPEQVREAIETAADVDAAAKRLIDLALELDGSDNATVLVAKYSVGT